MRAASPRKARKNGVGGSQWLGGDPGPGVGPHPSFAGQELLTAQLKRKCSEWEATFGDESYELFAKTSG